MYPNLSNPKKEQSIHDGRKRIDIRYNNSAESGFFFSLPIKDISLICPFVFVECKNYAGDPANPEIDQLSGRFSNRRGRVGILACRSFEDEHLFIQRCADTFHDGRGLVIPLADKDFKNALSKFPALGPNALEEIINEKYERITFLK